MTTDHREYLTDIEELLKHMPDPGNEIQDVIDQLYQVSTPERIRALVTHLGCLIDRYNDDTHEEYTMMCCDIHMSLTQIYAIHN